MGTHSDGYVEQELLTTFVTCEGDLSDPQFNTKFARLLKQLQKLLLKDSGQYLGVVKVEPWNSVRVTFTVPKEAALRLRQLAQQGDATLSQLGILSVQLEGDQAISLRIAGRVSGESQEIVLRTTPADNESVGSQSSATEADLMISKSVVVSASGGPASFIRTMTQLVSGAGINQPLSAFKSPTLMSPVNVNSSPSFSVGSKVTSPAVISTVNKTTVPHPYHSSFLPSTSSTAVSSVQNRDLPNNLNTNSLRFPLPPPPPYPNLKNSASHMIKLNRSSSEEVATNPSPANVALSSPLLVNLLQNDGGVPLNNCKSTITEKPKMKSNMKPAVPVNTVKRKDSVPETSVNVSQSEASDSSSFPAVNVESQVIQRIQRTSTPVSEPLTMVTNVRIPVESCNNSESVIVSSGKLPAMNHLTVATANVKQNFPNQSQLVNIFQGQLVPAGSNTVVAASSHPQKTAIAANQFVNRVASVPVENQQIFTVSQGQKIGVRVINVPSQQQQQQHLLQSQQLVASKQMLQHPQQSFQPPLTQQQFLIQQQQQQLLQQQKSVISQSTPSAKINVTSVQELNKLYLNQNSPVVSSVMVSNNRLINQFPLNALPQQVSSVIPGSKEQRLDSLVTDRNLTRSTESTVLLDQLDKTTSAVTTSTMPRQNIMMGDGTQCHIKKSDSIVASLPNGNRIVPLESIVTCAALQLVKTLTFTNPNLSQVNSHSNNNIGLSGVNTVQETKLNVSTKFGPALSQQQQQVTSQAIIPSATGQTTFNPSPNNYHSNTIVTNSSTISAEKYFDHNTFHKNNQLSDLQSAIVYSKSDANSIPDGCKVFQPTKGMTLASVPHSINYVPASVVTTASYMSTPNNQQPSVYVNSTTHLPPPPQYPLQSSNSSSSMFGSSHHPTTGEGLIPSNEKGTKGDSGSSNSMNSGSTNGDSAPSQVPQQPFPSSSGEKEQQFLINPLTGELEAMPTESSDNESDQPIDVFNSLPPSVANNDDSCLSYSSPATNEKPNSMYSDDDDELVTSSALKKGDVDPSDSIKLFNSGDPSVGRHRVLSAGSNSSAASSCAGAEKIKIRLKLEKNEAISSNAYKVDVLNSSIKKVDKPTSIVKPMPRVLTTSASSTAHQNSIVNSTVEEPRVPPIRLTRCGNNLAFVKKNKKWAEVDSKDSIIEDGHAGSGGNEKKGGYFNSRSKMSPCEVIITDKEPCLAASDSMDSICRLPKSVDGGNGAGVDDHGGETELKMKLSKSRKLTADSGSGDDLYSLPAADCVASGDAHSSYSSALPSVRTFPTEAEVTSILRSVPADPHNKMSLSSMKIKKKEGKKKFFTRDRSSTSILTNATHGDDVPDAFTRVINETKCTLSSQSRVKSKSTPTSLLKKVMKSGAADARFMNMANRNAEKRLASAAAAGPGSPANFAASDPSLNAAAAKNASTTASVGSIQRRSSADMTYSVSAASFSNVKLNPRSSEALVTPPPQYQQPTSQTASSNLYGGAACNTANSSCGEKTKKFVANAVTTTKKVVNNCKTREYQSLVTAVPAKNESSKKDFHVNHESKKNVASSFSKKNASMGAMTTSDVGCKQNIIVNCLQVESNPLAITSASGSSIKNVDLSEKLGKQSRRLSADESCNGGSFGEPARKKARLESAVIDHSPSNAAVGGGSPLMDHHHHLLHHTRLPNKEGGEFGVSLGGGEGDSPSAHTTEQTNNQGEDSGIESMDALSEKSPNQGESPCRKDEKDGSGAGGVGGSGGIDSLVADSRLGGTVDKDATLNAYCDKSTIDSFVDDSYCASGDIRDAELAKVGAGNRNCSDPTTTATAATFNECGAKTGHNCSSSSSSITNPTSAGNSSLETVSHNSLDAFGDDDDTNTDKDGDSKTSSYDERHESLSPDLDDVQPFRVTPALYTYSNPEKIRVDSPSPVLEDITDEISLSPKSVIVEQPKTSTRLKRKRKESSDPMYITTDKNKTGIGRYNNRNNSGIGGKSLLKQLLIDIPDNNAENRRSGMSTRNTRSQVKGLSQPSPDTLSICSTSSSSSIVTPKCSPVSRNDDSSKPSSRPSSRQSSRRSRKGSESSNVSNSDESSSYGPGKRKTADSVSDLMKTCAGFEDQNNKKMSVSTSGSVDCYRPLSNESSIISTATTVVTSSKADVVRSTAGTGRKTGSLTETLSQSFSATRPAGKRRKAANDAANKRGTYKSHASSDLIQVATHEVQEGSKQSPSIELRGNQRPTVTSAGSTAGGSKLLATTPSASRRSVRQNHMTRRRKSPAAANTLSAAAAVTAVAEVANSSLLTAGASSNNNNCTNKNNNNPSCSDGNSSSNCSGSNNNNNRNNNNNNNNNDNDNDNCSNSGDVSENSDSYGGQVNENGDGTTKSSGSGGGVFHEKNGVGILTVTEKTEAVAGKNVSKVNYVTKKDSSTSSSSSATAAATTVVGVGSGGSDSQADSKGSCGALANIGAGAGGSATISTPTVTTRGNSVKQTPHHPTANDSSVAAPPHDVTHTHTAPASEEVINTRRKTRSVSNLNGT